MVKVEIIYITAQQEIKQFQLSLPEKATLGEALQASGLYQTDPETKNYPVGIFGKPASLKQTICHGDRIEIYRPLRCDPMEKRRQRAKN